MSHKYEKKTLSNSLHQILEAAQKTKTLNIGQLQKILAGKASAILLIILSLPFCIPIQIPGFSTPFGIIIGFLGLRIAFGRRTWLPQWILQKNIETKHLVYLVNKLKDWILPVQRILHPRLTLLTENPFFRCVNGLLICFLAFLLAMPLPIPMTNLFSAIPILFIAFGLLESDGFFILIGYGLAILDFIFFSSLILFGITYLKNFF